MATSEKNWVRKLRIIEEFYTRCHDVNNTMTAYLLHLSSRELISEDQMRIALIHLFRYVIKKIKKFKM